MVALVPMRPEKKPTVPRMRPAKKEVEVALVVVTFWAVTFCNVVEPRTDNVPVAFKSVAVTAPANKAEDEAKRRSLIQTGRDEDGVNIGMPKFAATVQS